MPAIVTLTMNPAVDISTTAERVRTTDKVRCGEPCYDPGGGGINVARIVRVLGETVVAVFPVGSATGAVLGALLDREACGTAGFRSAGATRESFTVDERSSGEQYRFVLPGPHLSRVEQEQCLSSFAEVARDARYVVASGSLPRVPLRTSTIGWLRRRATSVRDAARHFGRVVAAQHFRRIPPQTEHS